MLTSSFDIGGAETHILTLARELKGRGHTLCVMSGGGCYVDALSKMEIEHRFIPLKTSTPLSLFRSVRLLSRTLREAPPDIIHAHTRNASLVAHIAAKAQDIPIVTTAHLCFSTRFPRRQLTDWGERTLAVSEDIRAHLEEVYGVFRDNITVTVNGIDGKDFYPPRLPPQIHSVVTVSRLDNDRSHTARLLIRIAERLYRAFPDFQLTVVGDGTMGKELSSEAAAVNRLTGKEIIRFLGRQSDIAPILRQNAVFVGCSRAALEAISCGCLAILSGDEGYLSRFSPDNAMKAMRTNFCFRGERVATEEDLYMDISALFSMETESKNGLIRFGINFIKNHYNTERMAEDAERIYRAVMRPPKGKRAVVAGYYGYENLGDEATLRSAIRLLRDKGFGNITVLTNTPRKTRKREGVHAIFRYAPLRIFCAIRSADIFLFGGGTLLQDKTSKRSLFYYDLLSRIAKATKTKFIFFGGIGGLSTAGERRAAAILSRTARIHCRTPSDVSAANALGSAATLYPDLAFSYPASYAHTPRSATFVFCLQRGNSAEIYENILLHIIKIHKINPIFAVLCQEDLYKAKRMAQMTNGRVTPLLTPTSLLLLFSEAQGAIGTRLHFLIFALKAGLPVFALGQDEKGRYLAEYVNSVAGEERMGYGHASDDTLATRLDMFMTKAEENGQADRLAAEKLQKIAMETPCFLE